MPMNEQRNKAYRNEQKHYKGSAYLLTGIRPRINFVDFQMNYDDTAMIFGHVKEMRDVRVLSS
jgi:hypothetical protein